MSEDRDWTRSVLRIDGLEKEREFLNSRVKELEDKLNYAWESCDKYKSQVDLLEREVGTITANRLHKKVWGE